jgi:hypothetical protein
MPPKGVLKATGTNDMGFYQVSEQMHHKYITPLAKVTITSQGDLEMLHPTRHATVFAFQQGTPLSTGRIKIIPRGLSFMILDLNLINIVLVESSPAESPILNGSEFAGEDPVYTTMPAEFRNPGTIEREY